ncbi:MAG TPA: PAS domain-containing protein [Alphaproteobacteria bacterium]|nr:PAS domain-containing protein [Alphaproteobacteria bacterium]
MASADTALTDSIPNTSPWHPKLRQIYDRWRAMTPEDRLPGRQHLDPVQMGNLLPCICLLDIQREPFRVRFRLAGTNFRYALHREITGAWIDEVYADSPYCSDVIERYKGVAEKRLPSWRRGKPLLMVDAAFSEVESLVLPLARDGVTVDMLIMAAVYYRRDGTEF